MCEQILYDLLKIAERSPACYVEINPFFNVIIIKETPDSIPSIYKRDKRLELDDKYSDIILKYPQILGVIDGNRIELIIQGDRILKKP